MDLDHPFFGLAVALGIGLLIGLEREQSAAEDADTRRSAVGGSRTFPLVAMWGAVATLLAGELGPWIVPASFGGLIVLVGMSYMGDLKHDRDRGMTSEVAFVMAFMLGALSMAEVILPNTIQRLTLTAGLAVTVTLLLSAKAPLHGLAKRVSDQDIYATLKFLVVAVIVLPLLPN